MEVDNIEMARQMVNHYTQNPPSIRQRNVYVQYSKYPKLERPESSPADSRSRQVNKSSRFFRRICRNILLYTNCYNIFVGAAFLTLKFFNPKKKFKKKSQIFQKKLCFKMF